MTDSDIFTLEDLLGKYICPDEILSPVSIFLDETKLFYRITLGKFFSTRKKVDALGKCLASYLTEQGVRYEVEKGHLSYIINVREFELDKLVTLYKLKGDM